MKSTLLSQDYLEWNHFTHFLYQKNSWSFLSEKAKLALEAYKRGDKNVRS